MYIYVYCSYSIYYEPTQNLSNPFHRYTVNKNRWRLMKIIMHTMYYTVLPDDHFSTGLNCNEAKMHGKEIHVKELKALVIQQENVEKYVAIKNGKL